MSDHRDDRTQPMLLKQASKRGAEEWRHEDAEAVIANLLAALDRAEVNTAAVEAMREACASVAECAPYKRGGIVCACSEGLGDWTAKAIRSLPTPTPMTVQCCMCGKKGLSTVDGDGGAECELPDGRWTCSRECWDRATEPMTAQQAARVPEVAARRLTPKQVSALLLLQKHGTPVTADTIHCHDVWYARDVLDRLVKRSLVRRHDFIGGVAPLYEITGLGRAAITEAKP